MAEKPIMYAPHQLRTVKRWAERQMKEQGELNLAFICQHASCDVRTGRYLLGELGYEGYKEVVQLVPEEPPAAEAPPPLRRRGKKEEEEAVDEVS